ncbi:MAG: hypothetical protein CFE43_18265 [Burkholderiales bacterium PBB3]|nr:MAG: hypothetical protein CFE43_18265 [Burkholderiales bacterium PBB3]
MAALPSRAARPLSTRVSVALRLLALVALMSLLAPLTGCSGRKAPTAASFVGKWQSSKLDTPVHLYSNGEWEIKKDDGSVLQYGVWEYKDGRIIWNYKMGSQIGRDVNIVQSVNATEFRLHEDQAITTFKRLD